MDDSFLPGSPRRQQVYDMMQPQQPLGDPGMGFLDYIKRHNPGFIETLRQISTQTQPGPFTSGRAMGRGLGAPPVGGGGYNPGNITGGLAGGPTSGGGGGLGQYLPGAPQGQSSPDLQNAMVQLAELLARRGQ